MVLGNSLRLLAPLGMSLLLSSVLSAQETAAAAQSPQRLCCSSRGTALLGVVDSGAGVLRVARNPAALHTFSLQAAPARVIGLGLEQSRGTLHRPQDANASQSTLASAWGWRTARRWLMTGGVGWRRFRDDDVAWRNVSDAYRGAAYVWADSVGGTWRGDALQLNSALASPAWRNVRAGFGVDYGVGQGARRNASRPLYRRRVAELTPALMWTARGQSLAASAVLGWQREDLEIGGGGVIDPTVFRFRGISTFDRTQLVSAERAMIGSVRGATVAYAGEHARWAWAIAAGERREQDSVRDGIGRPEFGGGTARERREVNAVVRRRHNVGGSEARVSWQRETARGTDPVFRAVNQVDVGALLHAEVMYWHRGQAASTSLDGPLHAAWLWGIEVLRPHTSRRDVVAENAWEVQRTEVGGRLVRRQPVGAGSLVVGARLWASTVTDSLYRADRATVMTARLARPDFDVHAAAQRGADITIAYEWQRVSSTQLRARVRIDSRLVDASDNRALGGRQLWRLSSELY